MSLVMSKDLFVGAGLPLVVERIVDRSLIQRELHRHEYFEILYVEEGRLTNRFKNMDAVMKTGDLLIMKPYVLHVLKETSRPSSKKAYCCSFLPQAADFSLHSLDALKLSESPHRYFFKALFALTEENISVIWLRVNKNQRGALARLFRQLSKVSVDQTERSRALTRWRFLELLILLSDLYESDLLMQEQITMDMSLSAPRYHAGLQKALGYIHDHFNEPLQLKDMAALCGASKTYFCKLFKHETGLTFITYLNGLRIERARVLLADTCDNALDICYQVGFSDYTHFSRQFKKHAGISPAGVRDQKRRAQADKTCVK